MIWVSIWILPDNKLHVVVCDVGQGDAILVTRGTNQMLIDGGPDKSVLNCLAEHMPFYDHRIEVIISTHPQADHLNGFLDVLKRYAVLQFVKEPEGNNTQGYRDLMAEIRKDKINTQSVYTGDEIKLGEIKFKVIWPEREFVEEHITTSPSVATDPPLHNYGEGRGEVVSDGTDLNSFGIVGRLSYGDFDVLLTADADMAVEPDEMQTGLLGPAEVLKVPHHGSRTGMISEWLNIVRPQLAIISVGKHNKYGHPAPQALDMLKTIGSRVLRTDRDGEVEVVSDGKAYWLKNRN